MEDVRKPAPSEVCESGGAGESRPSGVKDAVAARAQGSVEKLAGASKAGGSTHITILVQGLEGSSLMLLTPALQRRSSAWVEFQKLEWFGVWSICFRISHLPW